MSHAARAQASGSTTPVVWQLVVGARQFDVLLFATKRHEKT